MSASQVDFDARTEDADRDVLRSQQKLPSDVFKTLVTEFCVTLMAQGQLLDGIIDDVNRAQALDSRFTLDVDPPAMRQKFAPNIVGNAREDGPTAAVEEPSVSQPSPSSMESKRESGTKRESLRVVAFSSTATDDGTGVVLTASPSRRLFPDVDEMKHHIRHAILKPYDVSQYYHTEGICSRVAGNTTFESITFGVIALSAIWLAIDADVNDGKELQEKHVFFQVVEYFFLIYFLVEILIRFGAFYSKWNCLKDFWFAFDACLAVLMCVDFLLPIVFEQGVAFDTSFIRLARLVKLTRMARIAHLLNKFPELSVLLKGMGIGARSVAASLLLLFSVVYVFAVAFRYLTVDTDVGYTYFRSVPFSMKVLILHATMPDAIDFVDAMGAEQILYGVIIVLYIVVASLTLMNMLIGILVEVIDVVALGEREAIRTQLVKDHLTHVMAAAGLDDHVHENLIITMETFQQLLMNRFTVRVMRDVGVDAAALLDFVEYIFDDDRGHHENGITFEKFVELACSLGGTNLASVKDVVDMRQVVMNRLAGIQDSVGTQLDSLQSSVAELIRSQGMDNASQEQQQRPIMTVANIGLQSLMNRVGLVESGLQVLKFEAQASLDVRKPSATQPLVGVLQNPRMDAAERIRTAL